MTKSNQVIIDYIISCIKKGMQSGKILADVGRKWQKSVRTANRLLKIAKEQHTVEQAAIKSKLVAIDTEAAIEARKKAIMTADERKEYLTKIVKGEVLFKRPIVLSGKIVEYKGEPDAADRLRAISELNKMEGDYAETSIKLKGDKENPISFELTLNI